MIHSQQQTSGGPSTAPHLKGAIGYPYPIDFLSRQSLADVIDELADPTRIIDIHEAESIGVALENMYRHGVNSLVMYRMVSSSEMAKYEETKREYYAFITMADIASYLLFRPEMEQIKTLFDSREGYQDIKIGALKTPVCDIRGTLNESAKFIVLSSHISLYETIDKMRTKGAHHILAYHPTDGQYHTSQNKFVKPRDSIKSPIIIGQSDIVHYLSKRIASLGEIVTTLTAETLMQFSFRFTEDYDPNQPTHLPESRWTGSKMKYAVHQPFHYSAFNCFKTMSIHRMSAVAIVDDNGHLAENLSISDFGILAESKLGSAILFKPVIEFLQESFEARKSPIFVKRMDSLPDILDKMAETEVHRVWVVDNQKPVGCVSMSDILAALIPMGEEHASEPGKPTRFEE